MSALARKSVKNILATILFDPEFILLGYIYPWCFATLKMECLSGFDVDSLP